jgi:hypothetical protein
MNQEFALNTFFPVFLASYEAQIRNAQKSVLKATSEKAVNFAKLESLPDEEKLEFIYGLLLIHSVHNSVFLTGLQTKLFTESRFVGRVIELKFKDEDVARYKAFRNATIGLEEKSEVD